MLQAVFGILGVPLWLLPAQMFSESMSLEDGTELRNVVYRPTVDGEFPAVLVRTPYGADEFQEHMMTAAENGTIYVVQDVRGTGSSTGTFCFRLCDGLDGAETVEWITAQPWSNGTVVLNGTSAPGMAALQAAPHAPAGLAAISADLAHADQYAAIFRYGALRPSVFGWLATVVDEPAVLEQWDADIAAHPLRDEFWAPADAIAAAEAVEIPVWHATGWYDVSAPLAIEAYRAFAERGTGEQFLAINPFGHSTSYTTQPDGSLSYGDVRLPALALDPPIEFGAFRRTFEQYHLGTLADPGDYDELPPVLFYVFGDGDTLDGSWRTADRWPIDAAPIRLHLRAEGLLDEPCPAAGPSSTTYLADPSDPVPTVAPGMGASSAGPFDQRFMESREDVVLFSTAPFEAPVEVIGELRAHLFVEIDAPDADLVLRVTDVYPDGRSILLRDNPIRLAARNGGTELQWLDDGEIVEVEFSIGEIANVFAAGHRLRVSIASSSYPKFFVNPSDGSYFGQTGRPRPVSVTVHHDADHPSYLEVPMPERSADEVTRCQDESRGEDSSSEGDNDGSDAGGMSDGETSSADTTSGDDGANGPDGDPSDSESGGSVPPTVDAADDAADGCGCRTGDAGWPWSLLLVGLGASLRRRSGVHAR